MALGPENPRYEERKTLIDRIRDILLGLSDEAMGWLLIAPAILVMAIFIFYPILMILGYSFTQRTIYLPEVKFIGLLNFIQVLQDIRFWLSLKVTLIFTFFAVLLEFILGLAIALILNSEFRGRKYVRAISIIPWALPTAVMALGWRWLLNDEYGIIPYLMKQLGLVKLLAILHIIPSEAKFSLLGTVGGAMTSMILIDVWKTTPFMVIILLAGLQAIPKDLYEAMDVDGATKLQQFFLVTLPLLRPAIGLSLMFRSMYSLGIFDLPWVLTGGGPGNATRTVAMYLYDTFFRYMDLGYGSAVTVITSLIIFGIGFAISIVGRTRWAER